MLGESIQFMTNLRGKLIVILFVKYMSTKLTSGATCVRLGHLAEHVEGNLTHASVVKTRSHGTVNLHRKSQEYGPAGDTTLISHLYL